MEYKLPFYKYNILHYLFFLLFLSFNDVHAQCAGEDNTITICDISIVSNQSINLFNLLNGTPTTGGVWNDDLLSGGLNITTGELNVLDISESGVYSYTYTVSNTSGCLDTQAMIFLVLGSHMGVPKGANKCASASKINLFELFNYENGNIAPHINGTWFDVNNNTTISGFEINPSMYNVRVRTDFPFTYTLPAVGSCPAPAPVTMILTLFPPANSGTPVDLKLCSNVDLSLYKNVNLFDLLNNEDLGGVWTEDSGTNEISGSDTFIDVQNIYNTLGAGSYLFTYTITPNPPICDPKSTTVKVIIENPIDFSNSTLKVLKDICENEINTATYLATITQNPIKVPNGTYIVSYNVAGQLATASVVFTNGVANFNIPNSNFPAVGSYIITIEKIVSTTSLGICNNPINIAPVVIKVLPLPNIDNAAVTIADVCQSTSATVILSNLINLVNGNYLISYNLSGSNTATAQTAVLTVTNGGTSFPIPGNLLVNPGATTLTIFNILNTTTTCTRNVLLSGISFNVIPKPIVTGLAITTTTNVCFNSPITVSLTGLGSLTNIMINYNLSGANTTTLSQSLTLNVTGGNTSFIIPQTLLIHAGNTTITITDLTNTGNSCGTIVNNGTSTFTINTNPVDPLAVNQIFCKIDAPTVANLTPFGSQYKWYDTATNNTALASTTALRTGNYYVTNTNSTTNCVSNRIMISVVVQEVATPTLNNNGSSFCALDMPTLQNLTANVTSTGAGDRVKWYNAPSGGTELVLSTPLVHGATYFGFTLSNTSNCLSNIGLGVTVSLTDCNEVVYDFFIPDGFSPNGDGINDRFTIPNIDVIFSDYSIEIYNRYGNLMFKGDKNKPDWDGKNTESASISNGIAPVGVYFYILYFNKGNKSPKQGRLYLNR